MWYTSVVEQVTWQQGVWEKSSTRSGEKIPSTDLEKMYIVHYRAIHYSLRAGHLKGSTLERRTLKVSTPGKTIMLY